jgi:hypothetical protein
LVVALGLVASALWRAVTLEPVNRHSAGDFAFGAEAMAQREPLNADLTVAALDHDPFHPERRRPRQRFRLPSERVTSVARRPARPSGLPPSMSLTGTMAYGDGGGVAILRDRGSTRLVRVGEQVGDLTLRRVEREEVVFVSENGARIVVRVSKPGS